MVNVAALWLPDENPAARNVIIKKKTCNNPALTYGTTIPMILKLLGDVNRKYNVAMETSNLTAG